ncbi:APC family permease [Aeromicrobium sp.]|uniref:APC family permease n=1 Tax=Aeromicrobium sp. TaxID=1871063 RepID=UPI002FC8589B
MGITEGLKRALVGRKLRSTQLGETLLPKRIALPVFASDPLSSVAYSPDEIFLTLSVAGVGAYTYSWKIGLFIAFVMLAVVASYRQNVQAYQSGGGDYEVATVNLGASAGLGVASALWVDYVLTVAVSISSAAQYLGSAVSVFQGHEVAVAVTGVVLLTAINLRGAKESGTAFAIPTYVFIVSMLAMVAWGFLREFVGGGLPDAETAEFTILPEDPFMSGLGGLAFAFLLLRAFASGCATLTGVEAIANGVPAFRPPKGKNAATTLLILGAVATTLAFSIVVLANITNVRIAEDPAEQLLRPDGSPVGHDFHQDPIVGQLARVIFDHFPPGFLIVTVATGLILLLAANTAFNGFPVLGSILARDRYMPRQLDTRGDRLAFSNGIALLAFFAIALIIAFDAQVTRLIQLYIVGVFVSFTLSQAGMVRHWTRLLKDTTDRSVRIRYNRSRAINGFGFMVTGVVLVVVLITKFTHGAWIAILAMVIVFLLMKAIRGHYDRVSLELEIHDSDVTLPSRVHAIVLVSKLHKPTMRALAYARVSRPNTIEALTVEFDPAETEAMMQRWDELAIPVPLKVINSPYRELVRPVLRYVKELRKASPRDVITVYIPEYVVGRWWEQLLHNQTALRLKGRLLFMPGVMVTSVPYQLDSAGKAKERLSKERPAAGDVRRGFQGD